MKWRKLVKFSLLYLGAILFRNNRSKILFYHDVHIGRGYVAPDCGIVMGTPLEVFKKHLEVIRSEGYKIVPRIKTPKGEVAIMFDDGFHGIYDNRQFFYENEICPTVFLALDLIGKDGFLNLDEIAELQAHGFIFECHGWTHSNLAVKNEEELRRELYESKVQLSKMLQKPITEICLPIGYFSDHLIEQIKHFGYKEAYSSIPGTFDEKVQGFLRSRILCQFASPNELKFLLRGGYQLIKKRYERLHHLPNS